MSKTPEVHTRDPAHHTAESGAYQGLVLVEAVERMRRLETRVTNMMRSVGLLPGTHTPDPLKGTAIYSEGAVHVSSPDVSLAEIGKAAVLGCDGKTQVVKIILCNQLWGALHIHGSN